jgi:hypothetical protein
MIDGYSFHFGEPLKGNAFPVFDNIGDNSGSDSIREFTGEFTCNGPAKYQLGAIHTKKLTIEYISSR